MGVLLDVPTVGVTKKFFSVDGLTENYMRKLVSQEVPNRGEAIEIIGHNSGNVLGAVSFPFSCWRELRFFMNIGNEDH